MWASANFDEYKILDTRDGEKLEYWNGYILLRPDPQVIWDFGKKAKEWNSINAHYHRSNKGGGTWEFFDLPESWQINFEDLTFNLKPFNFKHTGLFPEQAVNWEWMRGMIRKEKSVSNREIKVLNLFAYTGGATIACAKEGAFVTHVDASKGMVTWAKENAVSSGLKDAKIRYLVDDCMKFVEREIRRENKYDAIIMDPPSYGRGPNKEIWKIEDKLCELVKLTKKILVSKPLFYLINSYTTGFAPGVLKYILEHEMKEFDGKVFADEIGIKVLSTNSYLPCGSSGRWEKTYE